MTSTDCRGGWTRMKVIGQIRQTGRWFHSSSMARDGRHQVLRLDRGCKKRNHMGCSFHYPDEKTLVERAEHKLVSRVTLDNLKKRNWP